MIRAHEWFFRWLDRRAIAFAAHGMPAARGDGRVHEAQRLLDSAEYIPTASDPAVVEFADHGKFSFASARPSGSTANDSVRGHFHPCAQNWKGRPMVLLLHGWNDVLNHHHLMPRYCRELNRLGINAATLQLPWHFDRRPRALGVGGYFLSADLLRTIEAVRQALADIRSFINWAEANGTPFIGLWGVSLGAWLAGLTACYNSAVAAVAMVKPIPCLDRLIRDARFCETLREAIQQTPIDLVKLNLMRQSPLVGKRNILFVEGLYDEFMPAELVEELWRNWGGPEIWRLQCGHVISLGWPPPGRRIAHWFAARAFAKQTGSAQDRTATAAPPLS